MPRHTAHFRGKLGRARRKRDLPQSASELIVDRVRTESFFLPFENYDHDLYPPRAPFGGFTSDDARNEQHKIQKYFPSEEDSAINSCIKLREVIPRNFISAHGVSWRIKVENNFY